MNTPPVDTVLRAFGAREEPVLLSGGTGAGTFRAGDIVLKRVSRADEAEWSSAIFRDLKSPGVYVPPPVLSRDARWVVDGWQASEFVEGSHAGPNGGRWEETIVACRAFHAGLAKVPRPAFLDQRDDAWSEADRLAFEEQERIPLPEFAGPLGRLARLLVPLGARDQVIHGDFTGNVLFAEGQPPCVIDFSPYWRPLEFALAIVISDAVSWSSADPAIVDLCADVPDFERWLARATFRRIWEIDCHARRGWPNPEQHLRGYLPTIGLIEQLCSRK